MRRRVAALHALLVARSSTAPDASNARPRLLEGDPRRLLEDIGYTNRPCCITVTPSADSRPPER